MARKAQLSRWAGLWDRREEVLNEDGDGDGDDDMIVRGVDGEETESLGSRGGEGRRTWPVDDRRRFGCTCTDMVRWMWTPTMKRWYIWHLCRCTIVLPRKNPFGGAPLRLPRWQILEMIIYKPEYFLYKRLGFGAPLDSENVGYHGESPPFSK